MTPPVINSSTAQTVPATPRSKSPNFLSRLMDRLKSRPDKKTTPPLAGRAQRLISAVQPDQNKDALEKQRQALKDEETIQRPIVEKNEERERLALNRNEALERLAAIGNEGTNTKKRLYLEEEETLERFGTLTNEETDRRTIIRTHAAEKAIEIVTASRMIRFSSEGTTKYPTYSISHSGINRWLNQLQAPTPCVNFTGINYKEGTTAVAEKGRESLSPTKQDEIDALLEKFRIDPDLPRLSTEETIQEDVLSAEKHETTKNEIFTQETDLRVPIEKEGLAQLHKLQEDFLSAKKHETTKNEIFTQETDLRVPIEKEGLAQFNALHQLMTEEKDRLIAEENTLWIKIPKALSATANKIGKCVGSYFPSLVLLTTGALIYRRISRA